VVNPSTNALETPVSIGYNADTMEVKDGVLYILRSPYGGRSEIVKVKLADKTSSKVTFPEALDGAANLDIYDGRIFYTVETAVYAMNIAANEASTTSIVNYSSDSAYGKMYGFAVNDNRIFIADGGDFTANSKAYIYSITGTLQKELTVGVGPNGFYFNN
jgi:hypothetical protein